MEEDKAWTENRDEGLKTRQRPRLRRMDDLKQIWIKR